MNIIEQLLFQPAKGMFREFSGVKTYLEPRDPALYRSLLPDPFSMPDAPVVMIFVADYVKVVPWPMTRYQEWAVGLKCVVKGEESWCVTNIAVTTMSTSSSPPHAALGR